MAQPPSEPNPQEEALFREVDEDLRHEKMVAFWKQFGGLVIGAAILVVAIVAGAQGWKAYQASARAAAAEQYEAAQVLLAKGDTEGALSALEAVAGNGASGYAPLAALRRAEVQAKDGKVEDAVAAYKKIANDENLEPVFRDAGRVLAVMRGMEILDPAEVDSLLSSARAGTGPWRALAEEMAAISTLKRGDKATAVDLLRGLANDPQGPGNSRRRAVQILSALGESPKAPTSDSDGGAGTETTGQGEKG
ncbi:MAG: tetratricopeptide repeat protein [Rhodospirillum sp.]|nr:tetratricopeptide repeat protein [Rhodospirillum sp.]MCF8488197.1 tetratricopeptide repeat protein [Rhodospirillum sp.]MCF8501374.1 tetratricopeptide repeat protein [Rhodospirillum sp.]